MKCKICNKDFTNQVGSESVVYVKRGWQDSDEWSQGVYSAMREVVIDAGCFCSDKCLIKYLEE